MISYCSVMFLPNLNTSLFHIRAILNESLKLCSFRYYYPRKIDTVAKRGAMLKEFFTNKDRRKNWDFDIVPSKPKARTFDKVHKPHRRRAVLNSLFIKNITDVLSTGDIIPEIAKYGVEISGVQISPCAKILNVFWQVPVSRNDSCEDIEKLFHIAAPKIRAELISRNVLGRMPHVYFLRDCTNARVAEFEQAMSKLEKEPKSNESSIVPDDSFTKDLYTFKDSKAESTLQSPDTPKIKAKYDDLCDNKIPKKPLDMKSNVFGLDHDEMLAKIMAFKGRKRYSVDHSAVISLDNLPSEDDLFSKVPGVCFKPNTTEEKLNREAAFKKFQIERKMLMEKHKAVEPVDNFDYSEDDIQDDIQDDDADFNLLGDFIEDETIEN